MMNDTWTMKRDTYMNEKAREALFRVMLNGSFTENGRATAAHGGPERYHGLCR